MKSFRNIISDVLNEAKYKGLVSRPNVDVPQHFTGKIPPVKGAQIPGTGGGAYKDVPGRPGYVQTDIGVIQYSVITRFLLNAYELDAAAGKKRRVSTIVWGMPGVGKSQILHKFAEHVWSRDFKTGPNSREFAFWNKIEDPKKKEDILSNVNKYYVILDVRVTAKQIEDVKGLPLVGSGKTRPWEETTTPIWKWLVTQPDSAGVLLLDEINQGRQEVSNLLYQILEDRQIDEAPIGKDVFICGAGNIGEHFAVEDLQPPVLTRAAIAYLEADPAEWFQWASSKNPDTGHDYVEPVIRMYAISDPDKTFLSLPPKEERSGFNQTGYPCPRQIERFSTQFRLITHRYNKMQKSGDPSYVQEQWGQEVLSQAVTLCGVRWGNGFMAYLDKMKEHTDFLPDTLEKTDFSTIKGLDKIYAMMGKIKNHILEYGEQVLVEGDKSKESELDRWLKISVKFGSEDFSKFLVDLKRTDPELWGKLAVKYYALNDPIVREALKKVDRMTTAI